MTKDLYDLLTDKTPPNVPDYRDLAFPTPPGVEMELVGISKEELARLKAVEDNATRIALKRFGDCVVLAQTLLKVSPKHKDWLEKNYKEYLIDAK